MKQMATYTCGIVGQAVTLTPKTGTEAHPIHLSASTIVFNTTETTPRPELWDVNYEYRVTIERLTKTN